MAKSSRVAPTSTARFHQGVRRTPPPAWIKPQLAKLVEEAPDGPDWLHELKFDGYRMHARLDAGRVQILTRRGNNWTDKYPEIVKAIAGLPAKNAYIDGELCGLLPDGKTAFNLIQERDRYRSGIARLLPLRPTAPGRRQPDSSAAGAAQGPIGIIAEWCARMPAVQ
jgi:ATP-dependent DNA ligase